MKVVISLSGGRDSATVLGLAVYKYGAENIFCMGFEYGSKHPCELEAAKKIASYYQVSYQTVKINPRIFDGSTSTLLTGRKEVETGRTYEQILNDKKGPVDTYVPARNTLFSAFCLAKAESLSQQFGGETVLVALGQHADDSGFDENGVLDASKAAYPDCSVEFVKAFAKVAGISSSGKVSYWTPFIKMRKWQLMRLGSLLDRPVPYHLCISCYQPIQNEKGEWVECEKCATDLDVQKAIKLANESKLSLEDLLKLTQN